MMEGLGFMLHVHNDLSQPDPSQPSEPSPPLVIVAGAILAATLLVGLVFGA